MSFDELQLMWQHDRAAAPSPLIDPTLLRRVRSDSRQFARRIFWRDLREVLASFVVAGIFGRIAWGAHQEGAGSWPAWIAALLALGVAGFFILDRWLSRRREAPRGANLLIEIERAEEAVNHQIRLLRNVFWWYLLPLLLSAVFLLLQIVLYAPLEIPPTLAVVVKSVLVLFALIPVGCVNWWIWKMNQKAVQEDLLPRAALLAAHRREFETAAS